ncbi:MAG: hypothetical protein BWY21_00335 [Parcubacteria group bacterium ADurb.Bin216]|nr:MAG: hypothetical protein BWY21_00335 [Parcubacteria group bacterium ADurb.Bin216]
MSKITRESYGNALLTLQRRLSDSSNKLCLETILLYVGQLESKLNQHKSCEEAAQSYGEKVSARHNGYLHPVEEATEGFKKGFAYAVTLLEKCHSIRHFLNDERYVGFGEAIEELMCELK